MPQDAQHTVAQPAGMDRLQALRQEHRQLDAQLRELAGRAYLTAEDQVEVARLKKQKLRMKDEILAVATELGVEV
jgi:hypothetical protein